MGTAIPLYGFGSGGGYGGALTVTAPAGVTVTVSKDGRTYTKTADASGAAVFKGLKGGTWTVTITDGTQTAETTVDITTEFSAQISFNQIPSFIYTGVSEIVNDADEPITTSQDNWKIRFLTSGTLTFTELNGAGNGIDVFLVGGGGSGGSRSSTSGNYAGGGGGGYTETAANVAVSRNVAYEITVGAGGAAVSSTPGNAGGESSAFGITANGGFGCGTGETTGSYNNSGGNGGSGGGGTGANSSGGTDGGNGSGSYVGIGQGTTTREFAQVDGTLYSSGGTGGVAASTASSGAENTGNGGDGTRGSGASGSGGSGIVIIRNAREVA